VSIHIRKRQPVDISGSQLDRLRWSCRHQRREEKILKRAAKPAQVV
jgi:hypothetical protein